MPVIKPTDTTPAVRVRTAYEIRKNHFGYGLYELKIVDETVQSETKVHEHDLMPVTLGTLAAILQVQCPEYKIYDKPSTPKG